MKYTLFFLLLLSCVFAKAQDTLFYKTGEVKPVQIIEIDHSLKIIGCVFNGDTLYVGRSTLTKYTVHSVFEGSTIYLEQTDSTISENKIVERKNILLRPSKFQYGKFSIGFNMLAPCIDFLSPRFIRNSSITMNPVLHVYGEYMLNNQFSIALNVRVGIDVEKFALLKPGNVIFNHPAYNAQTETIFEFGLQPTIYLNKQSNLVSFYIRPGVYFGMNSNIRWHIYSNEYAGPTGPYGTYDEFFDFESYNQLCYRIGSVFGLQFNPWKSLSIGLDAGGSIGNWTSREYYRYSNTVDSPLYKLNSMSSTNKIFVGVQTSLNLIYRFGSTARE